MARGRSSSFHSTRSTTQQQTSLDANNNNNNAGVNSFCFGTTTRYGTSPLHFKQNQKQPWLTKTFVAFSAPRDQQGRPLDDDEDQDLSAAADEESPKKEAISSSSKYKKNKIKNIVKLSKIKK
jgi:hypothetical protein